MTDACTEAEFLKTLTVLFVEDERLALEETSHFLRRRVGRIVTASHGAEALAAYRAERPDILLTDIQMPVLDGLGLIREIREADSTLPIIVATAFEVTDYFLRAIELSVDRYLLKPLRPAALEQALHLCAHRLWVEVQARRKQELEAEVLRLRHQATINTLLGGIGHDYNNLLQSILACQDVAMSHAAPGTRVREVLEDGRSVCEQARHLSKRLTALVFPATRISQVGPIEPLVKAQVESLLAGTAIQCECDFQAGNPPIRHDRDALRQALACLVANALEAMPEGGRLQVGSRLAGPHLSVTLRDTGRGIPADDLPRVFEPYFTTKRRGCERGTGLGLALCEALVHAHGGVVQADSVVGQGSTFSLLLPLA